MAIVGASQALTVLLIRPIFDRVLDPRSADAPVLLFTMPWKHKVYLESFVPASLHNVWTMVAFGILAVYALKGMCDYLANYLVNYVGFSAVTDLRQDVFEKVLRQDANFFEANSTARVMSSIMNDLEKIQVALSGILADLLRQSFTAIGLAAVVSANGLETGAGEPDRTALRAGADAETGTQNSRHHQTGAGRRGGAEPGAARDADGAPGGEVASQRKRWNRTASATAPSGCAAAICATCGQQAIASPLIEFFGAITIVGLLTYARSQIKAGAMSTGDFIGFVMALLMLYEPVKRLTGIHNIFQQALGASQKVFEYLDRDQQIKERPGAVRLGKFEKSIQFDNVSFRYPGVSAGVPDGGDLAGGAARAKWWRWWVRAGRARPRWRIWCRGFTT